MKIESGPRSYWPFDSGSNIASIVGKGETTLAQVASRIGVSVDLLVRANPNLNPNRLQLGQPIQIANSNGPQQQSGPNLPLGATFDAASGVQHTDGRLSPNAQYEELPSDLQSKMKQKIWQALPEGQSATLVASYQQFKAAGVWDEITEVVGQKEKREAPVRLPGGLETDVAGNSGAIQYRVRDSKQFVRKIQEKNPNFGVDGGLMGALHPGQVGLREAGPTTSLHISVGPGNLMDAHIDRVNPVDQPKNGQTQMNISRGAKNWRLEVLPEMIRKQIGPPGVIIDGDINGGTKGRIMVNLEFHGLRKTKPNIQRDPMEGSPDVSAQVMKNIVKQLADGSLKIQFPRPPDIEKCRTGPEGSGRDRRRQDQRSRRTWRQPGHDRSERLLRTKWPSEDSGRRTAAAYSCGA